MCFSRCPAEDYNGECTHRIGAYPCEVEAVFSETDGDDEETEGLPALSGEGEV